MSSKCLVLTSGGIDSTACVNYYLELGYETEGVFVDYGHPANPVEYEHIQRLCFNLGVPLKKLEYNRGGNVTASGEIRGRNAFLVISTLMSRPDYSGILALGIHAGSPYYDCGSRFMKLMGDIVSDYSNGAVQLDAPFMDIGKPAIVEYCQNHGIPLELTYSCEEGSMPPCRTCASCIDRKVLGLG